MLDITHQNFEAELINASMQVPVLLDIWAPWCGPCKTLGPVLEKLETAYAGRFALGKLNADERLEALTRRDGIASCGNAQNCVQVCPKEIPLTRAIAELHRDTTIYRIKKWLGR